MSDESPVYVVFGAYGGVGSALTRRLAKYARVSVSGRNEETLRDFADGLGVAYKPADATEFGPVEDVLQDALERFGRVDGVVNCVGSLLLKPAHLTREDEWDHTLQTNLTSAFSVLRAAAKVMSSNDSGGSIVLVSTAAAAIGLPNHEAIAAAKGGIDALVRSAAATYGKARLRVNAVAPGLVDSPLTSRITGNDRARQASEAMHTLKRIGTPDEVAAAIEWLLGPEANWVTGQTLSVDGGLANVRSA